VCRPRRTAPASPWQLTRATVYPAGMCRVQGRRSLGDALPGEPPALRCAARTQVAQSWPNSWARCRAPARILSQNARPGRALPTPVTLAVCAGAHAGDGTRGRRPRLRAPRRHPCRVRGRDAGRHSALPCGAGIVILRSNASGAGEDGSPAPRRGPGGRSTSRASRGRRARGRSSQAATSTAAGSGEPRDVAPWHLWHLWDLGALRARRLVWSAWLTVRGREVQRGEPRRPAARRPGADDRRPHWPLVLRGESHAAIGHGRALPVHRSGTLHVDRRGVMAARAVPSPRYHVPQTRDTPMLPETPQRRGPTVRRLQLGSVDHWPWRVRLASIVFADSVFVSHGGLYGGARAGLCSRLRLGAGQVLRLVKADHLDDVEPLDLAGEGGASPAGAPVRPPLSASRSRACT
jgi:hypothetical protein